MDSTRWLLLSLLITITNVPFLLPCTCNSILSLLITITNVPFLLSCTCNSTTVDDLHTLLLFKSLITKDPSGAISSWSSNCSSNGSADGFCSWTGVTCSSQLDPGRVTALRLRGLHLSGSISPFLGNLTRLTLLDLSDNKLDGEIPHSLGNCNALRMLNLSYNSLSGAIPDPIGNLSNLLVLNIFQNNISGTIAPSFQNLTRLTMFNIGDNYVHGDIPPWLGNLTALTDLQMVGNLLSGQVPSTLSKLVYLKTLFLTVNKLDGVIPPPLFNMSSLLQLNLGSNQLSGSLPQDMGSKLPNLRLLSVFYNNFEGEIPASLSNMSSLQGIFLHGNRFRGLIPPNIGQNGRLTSFVVGKNELQARGPRDWDFLTSLSNCSSLVNLDFQLNDLSGVLPHTIANLSQELAFLLAGGNQIAGVLPTGIGRYYKLSKLEFADNLFTGTIPSDIGKLSNLHQLVLFKNRFHGEIPLSLGNISTLNNLDLSSNNLEGQIPVTLGYLSELVSLDLSDNLLNGKIPEDIISIPSLSQILNLSNNMLGGPISPYVGRLVNVEIIDLSSNKLSGAIPNTLGSCIALQLLHLQGNLLHGQIPKELVALRGLEDLDLSNNNFSGSIPEFLESLQLLKNINLSFNQLSGPVPDKGIFTNASAVSLKSNGVLCGGPVSFHFPACPSPAPENPARNKLLHILLFSAVGAFILLSVCIATCYCINMSSANARQGQGNVGDMFQRMSYAELYAATDSFSVENMIGRGSCGSVYKGTLSFGANSITAAVKVIDIKRQGATRSFMSECNALKKIRHRNLVKIITVCDSLDHCGNEFKALVLEFFSNGSLDKWLHPSVDDKVQTLSFMQRLNVALDVAEALAYLHDHIDPPIVHCDIKPCNIFLDDNMVAHLGDFGSAKIMKAEESGQLLGDQTSSVGIKGTVGYLAPEYGMGAEISIECDVYSYGVLLLEMLTGRRPTDPIFSGAKNLPKYVEMACPDNLLEIVDVNIRHNQETQPMLELFIAPVSRLGIACCRGSATRRIQMSDVVKELTTINRLIMASQNNASSSTAQ